MADIPLSEYTPEEIAVKYKPQVEGTWYFFTQKVRKFNKGQRRNRVAKNGYWRLANTTDVYSNNNGNKIGSKSLLAFHRVIPSVKDYKKTDWIMHEFLLPNSDQKKKSVGVGEEDMIKHDDGYVLCRMYMRCCSKTNVKKARRRSNKNAETRILPHNVETAPAASEYHAHDIDDQNAMLLSMTPDHIDHEAITVVENPSSTTVSGENHDLGGLSSDTIPNAVASAAAADDDDDEFTAFLSQYTFFFGDNYYYTQLMENFPSTMMFWF
ncbi:NAC transcription factor 56 [Morus notabilis]|nr:NAC transcription factor 56 [Morus notabilis]